MESRPPLRENPLAILAAGSVVDVGQLAMTDVAKWPTRPTVATADRVATTDRPGGVACRRGLRTRRIGRSSWGFPTPSMSFISLDLSAPAGRRQLGTLTVSAGVHMDASRVQIGNDGVPNRENSSHERTGLRRRPVGRD
jgi:hypothetical protein